MGLSLPYKKYQPQYFVNEFTSYREEYNNDGNIIRRTYIDGWWVEYTYDKAGNVIFKNDSQGSWSKCEYDKEKRLISWKHSSGAYKTYTYDNDGKQIEEDNEQ